MVISAYGARPAISFGGWGQGHDFLDITYAYGFADQAPLIREFKSITGNPQIAFSEKRHKVIVVFRRS